jgi:hypothetical protein
MIATNSLPKSYCTFPVRVACICKDSQRNCPIVSSPKKHGQICLDHQTMKIQIKNRFDNSVIFETEAANTREAVLAAISQKVSLRSADLRSADLRSADLRSADLRSADLSSAVLRSADLSSAVLSYAVLRSADLNAETQLPYAPKIPDLDKQILERVTNGGTLDMKDWHTCETTHCRAGWAVVIAGEAGKVLESMLGPQTAATLIYHASTGSIPNFFASNDEAMEDLRKCAGVAK